MNSYEIVVIGAGPAGYCAAISAGRKLRRRGKVLLLEGGEQTGRKLMLSGSGQCNLTNAMDRERFIRSLGRYAMYLKPSYYNFDNQDLTTLLAEGGCESFIREDGKVFPASFKAEDVRSAFLKQLQNIGIVPKTNSLLSSINTLGNGFKLVMEDGFSCHAHRLILCTGGASYPQTGSDGKAVRLTKAIGHHPVPFRPHLCSVTISDFKSYSECAGNSISNAKAGFATQTGQYSIQGDLLVTHKGFSGPLILDNSHLLAKDDEITIYWFYDYERALAELSKCNKRSSVLNALRFTHIPPDLLRAILGSRRFDTLKMSELSKGDRSLIVNSLYASTFKVKCLTKLSTSMASAGGIPLSEINAKTMESRICTGLYFAGEIMDYALPTGGFNIQIACSTGWLAGIKAVESL